MTLISKNIYIVKLNDIVENYINPNLGALF